MKSYVSCRTCHFLVNVTGEGGLRENEIVWQGGEWVQKIPFCEWCTFWMVQIVIAYCRWCKEKRLKHKLNNGKLKVKKEFYNKQYFYHMREESPFTKYEEDNLKCGF